MYEHCIMYMSAYGSKDREKTCMWMCMPIGDRRYFAAMPCGYAAMLGLPHLLATFIHGSSSSRALPQCSVERGEDQPSGRRHRLEGDAVGQTTAAISFLYDRVDAPPCVKRLEKHSTTTAPAIATGTREQALPAHQVGCPLLLLPFSFVAPWFGVYLFSS
jgi:hypothetical protein